MKNKKISFGLTRSTINALLECVVEELDFWHGNFFVTIASGKEDKPAVKYSDRCFHQVIRAYGYLYMLKLIMETEAPVGLQEPDTDVIAGLILALRHNQNSDHFRTVSKLATIAKASDLTEVPKWGSSFLNHTLEEIIADCEVALMSDLLTFSMFSELKGKKESSENKSKN